MLLLVFFVVDVLEASAAVIGIGGVVTIGIAIIDTAFGIVVVGAAIPFAVVFMLLLSVLLLLLLLVLVLLSV